MATLQKLLVKVVARALNIFIEVQRKKFEIHRIAQMAADITAIAWSLGLWDQQIMNIQNYGSGTI